jgi:hypothetical protein
VNYDSSAGGVREDSGRIVTRGQAHRNVQQLFLVRLTQSGWRVADIKLVDAGDIP